MRRDKNKGERLKSPGLIRLLSSLQEQSQRPWCWERQKAIEFGIEYIYMKRVKSSTVYISSLQTVDIFTIERVVSVKGTNLVLQTSKGFDKNDLIRKVFTSLCHRRVPAIDREMFFRWKTIYVYCYFRQSIPMYRVDQLRPFTWVRVSLQKYLDPYWHKRLGHGYSLPTITLQQYTELILGCDYWVQGSVK